MNAILENVLLAPHTTLAVGGPARYFTEAKSVEDVRTSLEFSRARGLPLFVLGGGSNLLVSDGGFAGLVLKVAIDGIEVTDLGGSVEFRAGAGSSWDALVASSVANNCAGLECLSGIPGTVGGAPVQNIGAYGQDVSQRIEYVDAVQIATGEVRRFTSAECAFAYRRSIFNTSQAGRWIIAGVAFRLVRDGNPALAYRDLQSYFADHKPTLEQVRNAVIEIRCAKGMVLREDDPDSRSAGSFFKNPVLGENELVALHERAARRGVTVPSYPALDSQRKVSAAWLVEQAGFVKGFALGRAGISSKHALAIVNRGGASAAEIVALKETIQQGVLTEFGIELQAEPVMLGF